MRSLFRIFQHLPIVAMLVGGAHLTAAAQDHPLFSEYRFSVLAADLEPGGGSDDGVALSIELLTPNHSQSYSFVENLLNPRFHVGGNFHTDDGVNQAYAGLTWDHYLTDSVFVESSFGGALHDGETSAYSSDSYGCPVNFRESFSIGADITGAISVMASVDHMSNAGLCDQNQGLTNAGVRVGYRW